MNKYYYNKLTELLAKEYCCTPSDFLGCETDNLITLSKLIDGRRQYSSEKYFFHMATLGTNAVITAEPCLHGFLKEYAHEKVGHRLFEMQNLKPIEKELNKHGYTLSDTYHMFLPDCCADTDALKARVEAEFGALRLKYFRSSEIMPFYGDARLKNAITDEFKPERPDRTLLMAYANGEFIGAAGYSEDAPHFMQIGIDVAPHARSRGVGSLLVAILKEEIERSGDIPFYGTSSSNYHSWNIALNCGFRPAWVEIGAQKL